MSLNSLPLSHITCFFIHLHSYLLSFIVDVGAFVKEHECHEGFDEEFQTYILDEDKLCDLLEPICEEGGVIIDFHSCEIFPERWFELVSEYYTKHLSNLFTVSLLYFTT